MRDIYRVIGLILVTVVALLGLAALLRIVMSLPFTDASGADKRAEWVGAIGTMGAFAGAFVIAGTETRRRNQQEMLIARLRGASMIQRLSEYQDKIALAIERINEATTVFSNHQSFAIAEMQLVGLPAWTPDEIISLAPLPNNAAAKLTVVINETRSAHVAVNQCSRKVWHFPYDEYYLQATEIHNRLKKILDLIHDVQQTCVDGANSVHRSV